MKLQLCRFDNTIGEPIEVESFQIVGDVVVTGTGDTPFTLDRITNMWMNDDDVLGHYIEVTPDG